LLCLELGRLAEDRRRRRGVFAPRQSLRSAASARRRTRADVTELRLVCLYTSLGACVAAFLQFACARRVECCAHNYTHCFANKVAANFVQRYGRLDLSLSHSQRASHSYGNCAPLFREPTLVRQSQCKKSITLIRHTAITVQEETDAAPHNNSTRTHILLRAAAASKPKDRADEAMFNRRRRRHGPKHGARRLRRGRNDAPHATRPGRGTRICNEAPRYSDRGGIEARRQPRPPRLLRDRQ